jgi:hypothetical protein
MRRGGVALLLQGTACWGLSCKKGRGGGVEGGEGRGGGGAKRAAVDEVLPPMRHGTRNERPAQSAVDACRLRGSVTFAPQAQPVGS